MLETRADKLIGRVSRQTERLRRPAIPDLRAFDWLSLDVFNTAVVRLVDDPTHIFDIVEEDYRLAHPELEPFSFRDERIKAQGRAFCESRASGLEETSFAAIYSAAIMPPGWDLHELQQREIKTETDMCRASPITLSLYQRALEIGLGVIFISDMYLPDWVIDDILRRSGYGQHSGVFVSGEWGATKRSGRLYDLVRAQLGADARVLHVGDDYAGDVKMPRTRNWTAHYLTCHHPSTAGDVLQSRNDLGVAVRDHLAALDGSQRQRSSLDGFWTKIGYEVAGPLFAGFAQWIADRAEATHRHRVYFLARDGWILKQIYDTLGATVPSTYLYASRRSLHIPAITRLDSAALQVLTGGAFCDLTVAHYLARINLDPQLCADAIAAVGLTDETVVQSPDDFDRLARLFLSLESTVLTQCQSERAALEAYLRQEGFFDNDRVGLVDLGWQGTLQRSITEVRRGLSKEPIDVIGFYLGTFSSAAELAAEGHQMEGFLTLFGQPARWDYLIRTCLGIWEFLHTAPHGSVLHFELEGDAARPVFAPHDADEDMLRQVDIMQKAAIRFAEDLVSVTRQHPSLRLSPNAAAEPIERLLRRPSLEESRALGDLTHAMGLGAMYERRHLAKPPSPLEFLTSPHSLASGYRDAFWKVGYRRRLMGRPAFPSLVTEYVLQQRRKFSL